jgi:hypothetical protein
MFFYNDSLERFKKTFNKIKQSNLYDVVDKLYLNVVASEDLINKINLIKNEIIDSKVIITNFSERSSRPIETDTLNFLHKTCEELQINKPILYLHSKGVSKSGNKNVQDWIDYMEYFLIIKWRDCLEVLKGYDTCSVNLQYHPQSHYAGNFWWANSEYIKKLKKIESFHDDAKDRSYSEFWLLDNDFCKPYSLHNSNLDHYSTSYKEEEYKNG